VRTRNPVLTSVCAIKVPEPELDPVTPVDEVTVHENKLPATLEVRIIFVVPPEQIDDDRGEFVTIGIGLTVTITTKGVPSQPLALGVTVYVTFAGAKVLFVRT